MWFQVFQLAQNEKMERKWKKMERKWKKNGTEMEKNGTKWEKNGTEMEKMEQKWNQNGKNGNVPTPPTLSPIHLRKFLFSFFSSLQRICSDLSKKNWRVWWSYPQKIFFTLL